MSIWPRFFPDSLIARSGAFQTLLPLCGSPGIHRLKRPGTFVLALDTCEASGTPLSLANRREHLREILNKVHLAKSSVKRLALFLSGKPTLVSVIPPSCEASSL